MAFLQTTLPGQDIPPPCVHPQFKAMGAPCSSCLWCFQNQAWNERGCFIEKFCPLRQLKPKNTWDKEYDGWMHKARKAVRLEKLRAGQQRLLSEDPDNNPHVR